MTLRLVSGGGTGTDAFDDLSKLRVLPTGISDLALTMRDGLRGIPADEVRLVEALRSAGRWLNSRQLAAAADIRPRMAREHLHALATLGVVDMALVHGAARYRLTEDALSIAAANYIDRVGEAKLALTASVQPAPESA